MCLPVVRPFGRLHHHLINEQLMQQRVLSALCSTFHLPLTAAYKRYACPSVEYKARSKLQIQRGREARER